jgi:polyisoprenoid-binding protein YceI
MHRHFVIPLAAVILVASPALAADQYGVDPMHSSISFKIGHLGLTSVHGRFDEFNGSFVIDPDPAKCSFEMSIKTESVDTNNKQRDTHLRSGDFFNAKQFPEITFKSTSVKPIDGGYEVTGDLTLHGLTKSVTLPLKGGKTIEFPKGRGVYHTGYTADFVIKRTDFEIAKAVGDMLGDEIAVSIGIEGIKK